MKFKSFFTLIFIDVLLTLARYHIPKVLTSQCSNDKRVQCSHQDLRVVGWYSIPYDQFVGLTKKQNPTYGGEKDIIHFLHC